MANKRIYYAVQQVIIGDRTDRAAPVKGLQTVGITTNFNLEQVFQMGQLEIYQNIEDVPDVEITLNKVLDGTTPIYCMATELGAGSLGGATDDVATGPGLTGRQNARCDVQLSIFPDTNTKATGNSIGGNDANGNPVAGVCYCNGMYVSSVSYTFPVDGNFTEDVTLVGNHKEWSSTSITGSFDAAESADRLDRTDSTSNLTSGVNRRQHLNIANCLFPSQIPGVNPNGTLNDNSANGDGFSAHFQNITVSCDLGRESVNELGRFAPYYRYATFPIEVTAEFEVLATQGDGIQAAEEGFYNSAGVGGGSSLVCEPRYNLVDQTIRIVTCEGLILHLGHKNKLSSVNYTGGDTGGGNVTVSYSYTTFNDFEVVHESINSSSLFTSSDISF